MPKTAQLMATRGIPAIHIEDTCYRNALRAYSPSGQIEESTGPRPPPSISARCTRATAF